MIRVGRKLDVGLSSFLYRAIIMVYFVTSSLLSCSVVQCRTGPRSVKPVVFICLLPFPVYMSPWYFPSSSKDTFASESRCSVHVSSRDSGCTTVYVFFCARSSLTFTFADAFSVQIRCSRLRGYRSFVLLLNWPPWRVCTGDVVQQVLFLAPDQLQCCLPVAYYMSFVRSCDSRWW